MPGVRRFEWCEVEVREIDITGPVQLINLVYNRPRAFWRFLTHDPRALWAIFGGRALFSFGPSGGCSYSVRDRDLAKRIAEQLDKCD